MPLKCPDFESVRTFLAVFSGICVCGFILELALPEINQWYLALLNAIIFLIVASVASYLIKDVDLWFWMNLAAALPIFWILGGVMVGIESSNYIYILMVFMYLPVSFIFAGNNMFYGKTRMRFGKLQAIRYYHWILIIVLVVGTQVALFLRHMNNFSAFVMCTSQSDKKCKSLGQFCGLVGFHGTILIYNAWIAMTAKEMVVEAVGEKDEKFGRSGWRWQKLEEEPSDLGAIERF